MNSNFLVNINSFDWRDLAISRASCLDNLTEVIELIRIDEARIFGHPDLYMLQLPWGIFYEIVDGSDFNTIKQRIPWLRKDHHKTLQKLLYARNTNLLSRTLGQLNQEFVSDLNGLLGCLTNNEDCGIANNKINYNELKITYFTNNHQNIKWNKITHPFLPNLNYSNQYLANLYLFPTNAENLEQNEIDDIAHLFCTATLKGFPAGGDREARAKEYGQEIARRNFYEFCPELTLKEKRRLGTLRSIYKLNVNGKLNYISIDFEKCTFEWCDSKGKHNGEYLFNGKLNSRRDDTGKHDILIN